MGQVYSQAHIYIHAIGEVQDKCGIFATPIKKHWMYGIDYGSGFKTTPNFDANTHAKLILASQKRS